MLHVRNVTKCIKSLIFRKKNDYILVMGFFRLSIYSIIAAVFIYSMAYDVLYIPRIGHSWWIYKLTMLTIINLVVIGFFR